MSEIYFDVREDEAVSCDNCEWNGEGAELNITSDVQERITPGEIVPAGQCPDCGCLAYLSKPNKFAAQFQCEQIGTQNIKIIPHAERLLEMVRLFVDPTMRLPGGDLTRADIPRLKEDAAKLIKEITDNG